MDKEDENALFDLERVKRELALEYAKQLQCAHEAYIESGRKPTDIARSQTALFALQEAVAELMVRHNRTLWQAVQQMLDEREKNNGQTH